MKIFFIVSLIILGILVFTIVYTYWAFNNIDKSLQDWNNIKTLIDGDLKKDLMRLHKLSEEEYIQCAVGIWVISCIEEDDIKQLMKLKEDTDNEIEETKNIIFLIKIDQKQMRLIFLCKDKDVLECWGTRYMTALVKLLKQEPQDIALDEIERDVAFDFCDE
jgi:hypothetical protein